jgi:hypothetical protein
MSRQPATTAGKLPLSILTLAAQIGITGIVLLVITYVYSDREAKRATKNTPEFHANPEIQARSNASFAIGCALVVFAGAAALLGLFLRFG